MARSSREQNHIRELLKVLVAAPRMRFPVRRGTLEATKDQGVYLIFSPKGRVLHVGMTPKARHGIWQRLRDHLATQSSFTNVYMKGDGSKLRSGCSYSFLVVTNRRHRALLEALAIGHLCPAHIGNSSVLKKIVAR